MLFRVVNAGKILLWRLKPECVLTALFLILALQTAEARSTGTRQAAVFYYPHLHTALGGKGYEGLGGDMVFFSYLHVALEVLKNPDKYEIYKEGFSFDLYRGSRYQLYRKDYKKVKKLFAAGFPTSLDQWNQKQKEIFLEYGPMTVLYILNKIKRIRRTETWTTEKLMEKHLRKCAETNYLHNLHDTYFKNFYSSWGQFYLDVRKLYTGTAHKKCDRVLAKREKFLVRLIEKRRRTSRKSLLIIYGYAHDFGKYFNDRISYLGAPELTYAAICFHHREKPIEKALRDLCSGNFQRWLDRLGHREYFEKHLPASLKSGWRF